MKSSKREHLVSSAHQLFYREGFSAIGIDRVVQQAGVALGTLYRHFDSREDLIVAAMDQRADAFLEAMAGTSGECPTADHVLELFDNLETWIDASGGNGCFFTRAAAAYPRSSSILRMSASYKQRYLALVEYRLRASGWSFTEAQGLAPAIYLLLEGASFTSPTLGLERSVAQAKELARELLARTPPRAAS